MMMPNTADCLRRTVRDHASDEIPCSSRYLTNIYATGGESSVISTPCAGFKGSNEAAAAVL